MVPATHLAAYLMLAVSGLAAWGHADRVIERQRFRWRLRLHGYSGKSAYGQYVNGPVWKARRYQYLASRGWQPPCWCCGRPHQRRWPIHHLDYSRAGAGGERDRDLKFVCDQCHHRFHRLDHPRGLLRGLGVTLRMTTYLAWLLWMPVRLFRKHLHGARKDPSWALRAGRSTSGGWTGRTRYASTRKHR